MSSPAYSADRFESCHKYDQEIESAVKTYWGTFQYPYAWKAQLYQESLCDPDAVSPAGARGLAQFMPDTWREMEARFGIVADPHDDIAIDWGAYYMAKRMIGWRVRRPMHEKWRLALASYNAGFGNIINAQKACDNERLWDKIKLCLRSVTGPDHSKETKGYVDRTERWWFSLSSDTPWELTPALWHEASGRKFEALKEEFGVTRCFGGLAWGTYWQLWDGWITADHVHKENRKKRPDFVSHDAVGDSDAIDMVFFGEDMPTERPRRPIDGDLIQILGYPAASDKISTRFATVRSKRDVPADENYLIPTYLATIENRPNGLFSFGTYFEPVVGGMSGGLVLSDTNEPLGVLVGDSGVADYESDGIKDYFIDFVALADFHQYITCRNAPEAEVESCLREVNYKLDYNHDRPNREILADLNQSRPKLPDPQASEAGGIVCYNQLF